MTNKTNKQSIRNLIKGTMLALSFLLMCTGLRAQSDEITITGKISFSKNNESIPMANVVIKGTSIGVMADFDGNYTIKVPNANTVLQYSFIGCNTKDIVVGTKTVIDVALDEDAFQLDQVVVTAMGIERKASSLTYATDIVKGSELTRMKETNLANSLQGKSAGLVITPNSTGAGGSTKILLRGNKSASGNNQPLIVIDGIPMSNPTTAQQTGEYEGRDGGDALSNLNPDDVASINILKGASAAALYGSMASNGVILITTKKGKDGVVKVDFSSNTTLETPLITPELQSRYGALPIGTSGSFQEKSWGSAITSAPGKDRKSDYFRTGSTFVNSISISGGTEKSQSYLSYANTTANGITPTNDFMRHNMTVRQSFNLFDNRLTVDGSLNYITQHGNNRPHGGTYYNPIVGVYTSPANVDFNGYKNIYESYSPVNRYNTQDWYTTPSETTQNPFWILNRNKSNESRDRIIASGTAKLKLTDYLNVQGRLSLDKTNDLWERRVYASTAPTLTEANGRFRRETLNNTQYYGDILLNFNKKVSDFDISASIGSSFMDQKTQETVINSDKIGLSIPNFFVPENISGNGIRSTTNPKKRLNSVFGTAQIGYKEMLYLDVTGRNDWSSTLAFTNNMSYFYPSVGLTALINEMVKLPQDINLMKVRASYSIVGNDMPAFITNRLDSYTLGNVVPNEEAPFKEMKPEKIHSMEFGLDLGFFNNKINFDFTYYKTNSKNQFFAVDAPLASGYKKRYINTGNIENNGFESSVSYRHNFTDDLNWRSGFNISYNDNKVKELDPSLGDGVKIGEGAGFDFMLKEGGSFGDIYTKKLVRDNNGVIQLDDDGAPVVSGSREYVGNVNQKWNLGWSNSINYKEFSLYFLIDGKIGGKTVGMTQSYLDNYGVSEVTADARDNGGVDIGNGTKVDALKYYSRVAGKDAAGAEYVYNATNFRLREVSLGYTFLNVFGESRNLGISLVARNLFIIYKDAPHDPDVSMSTANGFQAFDIFGLPSTRSFGVNIKLNF